MIKSKTNTFGFWITPITMTFFLTFFIFIFFKYALSERDKVFIAGFSVFFLTLSVLQLWVTFKLVTIDTLQKTITFVQGLTGRKTVYNFNDLDGYISLLKNPARGKPFSVIYLIKEGKRVQEISGYIYSNVDELEEGLSTLKNLNH